MNDEFDPKDFGLGDDEVGKGGLSDVAELDIFGSEEEDGIEDLAGEYEDRDNL